jgi:hypothetical protein
MLLMCLATALSVTSRSSAMAAFERPSAIRTSTSRSRGVRHAIALFRGRDTSAESKRSAIFNLARILEERRALIKEHLHKKDEGALFQIANSFDLRHSNASQQREYDEAFLDWIFWWYLATVELTN